MQMKCRVVEACHDDKVDGCHFGRDKSADKVSSHFYWSTPIYSYHLLCVQELSLFEYYYPSIIQNENSLNGVLNILE